MWATTRAEYAARLRTDQAAWRELVAAVGPDRFEEPGPMGDWSFRDLAGHLAAWREWTVTRFEAALRGEPEPRPPWPSELEEDDPINAWFRDRDRDRSTEELIEAYDRSFERLAAGVEALPEASFEDPEAFPWLAGHAIRDLDPTTHLHDEHEAAVRDWLARRG